MSSESVPGTPGTQASSTATGQNDRRSNRHVFMARMPGAESQRADVELVQALVDGSDVELVQVLVDIGGEPADQSGEVALVLG
jgi:hypothetical protein